MYVSRNKRSILIAREVYWNCRALVRYMAYLYAVNSNCGRLSLRISFWQQTGFHIWIRKRTVEEQSSYNLGMWLYSMCAMMKVLFSHCTSSRSLIHVWLPSVNAVKLTCALWLWSRVFFAYDWRFRMQACWVQGRVIMNWIRFRRKRPLLEYWNTEAEIEIRPEDRHQQNIVGGRLWKAEHVQGLLQAWCWSDSEINPWRDRIAIRGRGGGCRRSSSATFPRSVWS